MHDGVSKKVSVRSGKHCRWVSPEETAICGGGIFQDGEFVRRRLTDQSPQHKTIVINCSLSSMSGVQSGAESEIANFKRSADL